MARPTVTAPRRDEGVNLSIRLPADMTRALRERAAAADRSLSAEIRVGLRHYLASAGKTRAR